MEEWWRIERGESKEEKDQEAQEEEQTVIEWTFQQQVEAEKKEEEVKQKVKTQPPSNAIPADVPAVHDGRASDVSALLLASSSAE